MRHHNLANETTVFQHLYNTREPQTRYEIAKNTKLNISSAYNAIDNLEEKGILVKTCDGDKKLYGLQPFFFNNRFWNFIIDNLKEITRAIDSEEIDPIFTLRLVVEAISPRT